MSEFKEKFNEIMDDLKGRIRNPLILSFILVWLYFHWEFIYQLFTINNALPVASRLSVFTKYIKDNGTYEMIFHPLWVSFCSLLMYYIIAIIAQLIKVGGKYLYSSILARVDPHSFVLRTELDKEKKHVKSLKHELSAATQENANLISFKESAIENLDKLRKDIGGLRQEHTLVQNNINYNLKFRDEVENTIIYLLALKNDMASSAHLVKPDIHKNHYKALNGSWKIVSNEHKLEKSIGSTQNLSFDNDKIYRPGGDSYGQVEDLTFDKKYRLLSFSITSSNQPNLGIYHLLKVNEEEMIGLYNHNFVYFKRHE